MLDFMRRQAQGWIVKVLFTVIVLSFVFWGVGDYFSGNSAVVVAEVGDRSITKRALERRVQDQRERMRQAFGESFDPDQIDPEQLRASALRQMIRERLLDLEVQRLGLTATDHAVRESIQGEPAFQRGGQFSTELYHRVLSGSGLGASDYESLVRQDLAVDHFRRFVQEATVVGAEEVWAAYRQKHERRRIGFFRLAPSAFAGQVELSEEELRSHYADNRERYRRPARVRVRFVVLAPEVLQNRFEPTEDELRRYLEENAGRYTGEEEGDKELALGDVRDEVAADWRRDRAVDEVYERLSTFEDLLYTRDSLGPVAKEFGLEIRTSDWIPEEGGLPGGVPQAGAFREEAFRTDPGRNSAPVELEDGRFAGLHPVERQPSQIQPYEEVKDRVRLDLRRQRARVMAREAAARARQAVAEDGDLASRAKELGVSVESSGPLTRQQARNQLPSGLAGHVFALAEGGVGMARVSGIDLAVFRVTEVIPPARDEMTDAQRSQLRQDLRRQRGQARLEGLLDHLGRRYEVSIREL